MDPDEAVLCWYDRTGRYQAMASYTGVGRDPVRVYIKIRAVEENGSLTINKVDAETGKALAGVTYRLYDSAGKKVTDVTTGADGKAVFKDLPQGKYSYHAGGVSEPDASPHGEHRKSYRRVRFRF